VNKMNYDEYFKLCRQAYDKKTPNALIENFYKSPVNVLPTDSFPQEYHDSIETLANKVSHDFDNEIECSNDNIMMKHENIWKFHNELLNLSNILVPYLEENKYGCHLYVDKIYIYRTLKLENRVSSYEWHYDNNPDEIVKTLIYLNDVTKKNSPFEYLQSPEGEGILGLCTRKGTDTWYPPPNNSRVGHLIEGLTEKGFVPTQVEGEKATAISFINNSIHRANPILEGYRDVVNIRVKPTLQKAPEYANPMFTTSYEIPGVVNRNPALAWTIKH